jgi:hypothetical protein
VADDVLMWNAPELVDGLGSDNMSHRIGIHHDPNVSRLIHLMLLLFKIIIQYFENMCPISFV